MKREDGYMDAMNKPKIVGIFGFIGSGKSHLTRSVRYLEGFRTISKEEAGVEWYQRTRGIKNSKGYELALYEEFKKDPLFLLKISLELVDQTKINLIDSINTPLEDSFLRGNYNYLLIQIWRNRKERMKSILQGRIKLVKSSEPTNDASFLSLDKLVKGYAHEGGCLHSLADEVIVNRGDNLIPDFLNAINRRWK